MRPLLSSSFLLMFGFAFGCGGAPPPTDRMASSEAAIRGAKEVGAESVPKASLQLKLAEEGVTKARKPGRRRQRCRGPHPPAGASGRRAGVGAGA